MILKSLRLLAIFGAVVTGLVNTAFALPTTCTQQVASVQRACYPITARNMSTKVPDCLTTAMALCQSTNRYCKAMIQSELEYRITSQNSTGVPIIATYQEGIAIALKECENKSLIFNQEEYKKMLESL